VVTGVGTDELGLVAQSHATHPKRLLASSSISSK
jgi:hypothetical protein